MPFPGRSLGAFACLIATAGFVRADPADLAGRYAHWNYAAEIQVRNPSAFDRPGEIVDVGLKLPAGRTANLANDARVVLKGPAFDDLVRELPFQLYDLETSGGVTTCRVAFRADLPAMSLRRFAVFYDNPDAPAPGLEPGVAIDRKPAGISVDTAFYRARFDPVTGECVRLQTKVPRDELLYESPAAGPGSAFPLPQVAFAGPGGERTPRLVPDPDSRDRFLEGPIFSVWEGRRRMMLADGAAPASVEFAYLFYPSAPHFVVRTTLRFLATVPVYAVEMNTFGMAQRPLTHYMFRPVSPTFPLTEVEEVGSIMIDPGSRIGLPEGDLLAGMLPPDLAWQSWTNIDRGLAVTGFQLFSRASAPDGRAPHYRASTRARLRQGWAEWSNAPIYVQARSGLSDAVTVPRGAEYAAAQAIYFSEFNRGDWRERTDDYGRRLNTRMVIEIYPRGTGAADAGDAWPHYGDRAGAYLRGIR